MIYNDHFKMVTTGAFLSSRPFVTAPMRPAGSRSRSPTLVLRASHISFLTSDSSHVQWATHTHVSGLPREVNRILLCRAG